MKGIYATGDIIGPPWLVRVASWEAIQAVQGMFGKIEPRKICEFPGCTYCQPQVASTTIYAHPTLSESVHEAAGQAFGPAIHI